jgi:WD40 repeat protein/tetratricopeptide (TPR) repeat protein
MNRSTKLCGVAICLLGLSASEALADAGLSGSLVMPKSDHVQLYANLGDADSVDAIYQIEWPAMASETNGCWVHLKDGGGYAVNKKPTKGWVRADQLVKLDSASSGYADHLNDQDPAVYYWLNGICWENQGSPDVAITNYEQAAAGKTQIADVEMRLGRLYAAAYYQYGTAKSLSDYGENKTWETHFENAEKAGSPRPRLYLDWGIALTYEGQWADAQQRSGQPSANDPKQCYLNAIQKLSQAEGLAPAWSPVPLARAELYLDCCTVTEAGVRKLDPRNADQARAVVKGSTAEPLPTPAGQKTNGSPDTSNSNTKSPDNGSPNIGSAKSAHNLVLWDRHADREIATFETDASRINSVAIHVSDDRKTVQVLSGGEDGTVSLWEYSAADQDKPISTPKYSFVNCSGKQSGSEDCSAVYAVAFSSDGTKVAVGTDKGAVRIWNALPPYGSNQEFSAHGTSRVSALAFSLDASNLLTGSWDGTAKLWNIAVAQPVCIRTFRGHTLPITSVAMLESPSSAATGHKKTAENANADAKSAPTKQHSDSDTSTEQKASSPADARASKFILTGSYDYSARLWNGADGSKIQELDGHCGPVSSLAFAGRNAFLTGSFDQTARFWRPINKNGTTTYGITLLPHPGAVTSLSAPNAGVDGTSTEIGSTDSSEAHSVEDKSSGTSTGSQPPADHTTPAGTGPAGTGPAGTVPAGTVPSKVQPPTDLPWVAPLGGHALADTINQNGTKSGSSQAPAKKGGPNATDADNAAPMMVLTGCADGHAEVWDASKAARLEAFGPEAGPVISVAISADGAYAVTASEPPVGANSPGGIAMVLAAAAKDCTRAISLSPKSAEAFRDRADVLRLQQRVADAQQSALNACLLTDFRDPTSLRLLAEIEAAGQDYDDASQHATQAAILVESDTSNHDAFLEFRDQCNAVNPSSGIGATVDAGAKPAAPAPNQIVDDNGSHHEDQNDVSQQVNNRSAVRALGSESGETGSGTPISIFDLRPQSQKPAPPSPLTRRFLGP